jgi:hypothetical protein
MNRVGQPLLGLRLLLLGCLLCQPRAEYAVTPAGKRQRRMKHSMFQAPRSKHSYRYSTVQAFVHIQASTSCLDNPYLRSKHSAGQFNTDKCT